MAAKRTYGSAHPTVSASSPVVEVRFDDKSRKIVVANRVMLSKAQERVAFLVDTLGSAAAVARILGISRSQPLRWSKGEEVPGPEAARLIVDLDYVMARAMLVWQPDVAIDWIEGANSYLEGARPIDVLSQRGPDEVVRALDVAFV